jgi:hypothetical protein
LDIAEHDNIVVAFAMGGLVFIAPLRKIAP